MQIKPKQRLIILMLALTLIFSVYAIIPIERNYVFVDNKTEKITAYIKTKDTDFQIKYIHSIHLSEVLESYRVLSDSTIQLTELQYEDFNIGMPSNAGDGETFVEKDGKYFIKNMKREMPNFRLFVGDVDAGLFFLANGLEFDLKKELDRGNSYTFQVKRLSLIEKVEGVNLDE